MDIPEHILKKILDVLKEEGNIEKVIIFGSRVKGTSKASSDIDIALVGENINLRQILRIGSKIEDLDLPYKVDLISYKDIKDKNLKEEIDKFGVEIELKKLIYKSPALFNASSISGFLFAKSFKTFSILSLLSSNSFVFLATGDRAVLLSHSINPIRAIIPTITVNKAPKTMLI